MASNTQKRKKIMKKQGKAQQSESQSRCQAHAEESRGPEATGWELEADAIPLYLACPLKRDLRLQDKPAALLLASEIHTDWPIASLVRARATAQFLLHDSV